MEELFARLQLTISQLADQVQAAVAAQTEHMLLAVLDTVLPVACGVLRVLAVVVALIVIVRCVLSLVREKTGKEIWGWLAMNDGTHLDLRHWENTVGRGGFSDVVLDFPTVSRSHIATEATAETTPNPLAEISLSLD